MRHLRLINPRLRLPPENWQAYYYPHRNLEMFTVRIEPSTRKFRCIESMDGSIQLYTNRNPRSHYYKRISEITFTYHYTRPPDKFQNLPRLSKSWSQFIPGEQFRKHGELNMLYKFKITFFQRLEKLDIVPAPLREKFKEEFQLVWTPLEQWFQPSQANV